MIKRLTGVLSFRLTLTETFILGAVLTALEAVQLQIAMSEGAHAAISMAVVLLGSMARPLTQGAFLAKMPVQVVTMVSAAMGAILILERYWKLGGAATTIIAVVLVALNSLGIGPSTVDTTVPKVVTPPR